MYGSTVLDVQHVGQVKSRKSQAPLWLALGGLPPFPADGTPVWALPQANVAPARARMENAAL